ncbi:MAG: MFS transporter, partial [Actinomycetota bacterium]|nr:MFS transporter [Actinomycetota bacterium]
MAALRALWGDLVSADARGAAYGLQSVLIEAFNIGGPLLAAALTALLGPAVAVLLAGGLELLGGLAFAATAAARRAPHGRPPHADGAARSLGPLTSDGLRVLAVASLPAGAAVGALDVALPAFAAAE